MPYEDLSGNRKRTADFIIDTLEGANARGLGIGVDLPSFDDMLEWLFGQIGELLQINEWSGFVEKINNVLKDEQSSDMVRMFFDSIFNTEQAEETAEVLGAAVMGPFISLMERYASDPETNPENFAAAFHGLNIMLTLPEFIAALAQGSIVGTVLGPIAGAFKSIYWNLGLGFLGWQTLAPFLSAGLQPRLEKHYNEKFKPKDFDLGTLMYLFKTGRIEATEFYTRAAQLGWASDRVRQLYIESFKPLSDSEIRFLHDAGDITEDAIAIELAKQNYDPKYIAKITEYILNKNDDNMASPTYTQARKAYKLGILDKLKLTSLLSALGWGSARIALELNILDNEMDLDAKELSISQIRQAYVANKISKQEVFSFLTEQGYDIAGRTLIVNTWDSQKAPKLLKLNQSTIKQAMLVGVLTQPQALAKLVDIGNSPENADIIVKTALAGVKAIAPQISIDRLITALSLDIISEQEFRSQLAPRKVSESDLRIYIAIAHRQEESGLGVEEIRQGYIWGAIDEGIVRQLLGELGSSASETNIRLETWRAQKQSFRQRPTPGMLVTFYRQHILSAEQLVTQLKQQGFSQEDAENLRKSGDLAFPRELSASEIKEMLTATVISEQRAVQLLKRTGLAEKAASDLVAAWNVLLQYAIPKPSVSALMMGLNNGLLSQEEFAEKLRELNYTEDSVTFYLALAQGRDIEVSQHLTKADILGLYKDELLSYTEALERLIDLGFAADDAELLLARRKPSIEQSQAHSLFMAGFLDPASYVDVLLMLGYSNEEIDAYVTALGY